MVLLDGSARGKSLLCLILLNSLLVLAHEKHYSSGASESGYKFRCSVDDREKLLHINKQITIHLSSKATEVYYFENLQTFEQTLSVTVSPCSSKISWSFFYESYNETEKSNETEVTPNGEKESIGEGQGSEMKTVVTSSAKMGCYYLVMKPLEGNARVNVYLTMDQGGPFELSTQQNSSLSMTPQKKQKLKISWARSLVNPQDTSYCIVVSRKKEFTTLCSAEDDAHVLRDFGREAWVNMKSVQKIPPAGRRIMSGMDKRRTPKDTVIICVDDKLQVTLTKMKKNEIYYFSLFAINHRTNFTIPYGKSVIEYNYRARPITLLDGVRRTIDLKKHSGEVNFKFKAYKKEREIQFYVLVCGGAVEVEFMGKDRKGKSFDWTGTYTTKVYGYKKFIFKVPGDYFLRVSIPDADERSRVEYIEVFATMHTKRYPLPALPEELNIYEYQSRRSCNSITIGWIPEPDDTTNKYCVTVRENRRVDLADKFRASYQCHLDTRSRKGFSSFRSRGDEKMFVYRKCKKQYTTQKISITNHTITNLKPGRSYTIQVTVQKKNGRTLSYNLLKAVTKHSCEV